MVIDVAEAILTIAIVYAALGLVIGAAFVTWGIGAVDASAAHSPWSFRAMVFPGVVALWPVVLMWWRRAKGGAR